ncbi:MAG: YdcF family protein [Vicinamibacterales bacterium]
MIRHSLLRTTLAALTVGAALASWSATTVVSAQRAVRYEPLVWANEVSGKNFPLFAILDADAPARAAIATSAQLRALLDAKRSAIAAAVTSCGAAVSCHVAAIRWSDEEVGRAKEALVTLARTGALKTATARMRASGAFVQDAALSDEAFVARAWERAARGVNNVLAVYALGDAPRYPAIDSISHEAGSPAYGQVIHTTVGLLDEQSGRWDRFYQPTLDFGLRLLRLNYRDEAGRHEPMHAGDNAAAFRRIPTIRWSDYSYTVALVPGAGLSDQMEREHHAISPMGMQIIEIAARRYFDRKVPLIIVSGGYVHPKHSQYAEAIEMKRVLMHEFGVPEDAIIVDPHARHTTTNVRNAARLMFRYGVPTDRPALITTQQYHLDSIAADAFDERNERELGYRPYVTKRRLSRFELEWTPNVLSLQVDPIDPLDP